jgi:hypothetical protein
VSEFGPGGPRFGEVCEHGSLTRKCEICELRSDLATSQEALRRAETALEERIVFMDDVDRDNDEQPFDLADERRRLVLAVEDLDAGDLHGAAAWIYGTQSNLAREFLRQKAARAALTSTKEDE